MIVRIARDGDGRVDLAHERCNGMAGLQGVMMASERFVNGETNMPGGDANMRRVTHPEIDMSDVLTLGVQDAEMVGGHHSARRVPRQHAFKAQGDLPKSQLIWRNWRHCFDWSFVELRRSTLSMVL